MAFNDLEVKVSANTRDLDRGLRNANRSQQRFAREAERNNRRLEQFGGFGGGRLGGMLAARGGRAIGGGPFGSVAAMGMAGGGIAGAMIAERGIRRAMQPVRQFSDQYERATDVQRQFFDQGERRFGEFSRRLMLGFRMVQESASREGGLIGNLFAAGLARLTGDEAAPFMRRAGGRLLGGGFEDDPVSRFQQFRRERFRARAQRSMISGAVVRGQAGEAQAIASALRFNFQRQLMTPQGRAQQEMMDMVAFAGAQMRQARERTPQIESF